MNKNMEAITYMKTPTYRKEVLKYIGELNYYRDMWPRRSHMLASLIKLTSIKRKFKWTEIEQYALDKIKRIVACTTLLTYPDFNEILKFVPMLACSN